MSDARAVKKPSANTTLHLASASNLGMRPHFVQNLAMEHSWEETNLWKNSKEKAKDILKQRIAEHYENKIPIQSLYQGILRDKTLEDRLMEK